MNTIYKYELEEGMNNFKLPARQGRKAFHILSAKAQDNKIVLYVLLNTNDTEFKTEVFEVVGTGFPINSRLADSEFVDTVLLNNDTLVYHVIHTSAHADWTEIAPPSS